MNTAVTNVLRAVKRPRTLVLVAGLTLFSTGALLAGPTDDIAECIGDSFDDFGECIADLPWYTEWLCDARFYGDVVLCALLGGLPH